MTDQNFLLEIKKYYASYILIALPSATTSPSVINTMTIVERLRVPTKWCMRNRDGTRQPLLRQTWELDGKCLVKHLVTIEQQQAQREQQGELKQPPKVEQCYSSSPTLKRIVQPFLKGTASLFMENMWRPFLPDIEASTFDIVAQTLQAYWGFILSMRVILLPDWPLDSNWRMQDFIFGAGDAGDAWLETMKAILKEYEENFGEMVDVVKGKAWLRTIIYDSRAELERYGFSLSVFDAFNALSPSKFGSRLSNYLAFLEQHTHEAHIKWWYYNGGKEDGIESIAEIEKLLRDRWTGNVKDAQLYEHAVKADCTLYMGAKMGHEVEKSYYVRFACCIDFIRARFTFLPQLLPQPQTQTMIEHLTVYRHFICQNHE